MGLDIRYARSGSVAIVGAGEWRLYAVRDA
jgi:hypothetical protein